LPVGSGTVDGAVDERPGARDSTLKAVLGGTRASVDTEFWLRHLNLGLLLYSVSISVSLIYLLLVPGRNRPALFVLSLVAMASVLVVAALPRRAIAASPRRLLFFYTWTAFSVTFILVVAALDGGAGSPLCLLLFFGVVYCGLAYPPKAVAVTTAGATTGYLVLTVVDASGGGFPLMTVVVLIGLGAVSAFAAEARERVHTTLDVLATHDGLTGCLTHGAFHDRLGTEVARAGRHHRPLSVVLVDLDHFKRVNDGLGHLAGDELLRTVGTVLRDGLRVGDAAGRLGGDEFALLLPETTLEGATSLAERRLEELAEHDISATFGVAQGCAGAAARRTDACATDAIRLLRRADGALYRAKKLGRRRVLAEECGCGAGRALAPTERAG
jgi:diguanylate cyclase (GGDEF)-like protein